MPAGQKRFIFLVQGEGRGHMTQAISLYQILRSAGHEVIHIFIGKSQRRKVPSYFVNAFDLDVELIESPNFITDPENKSIRLIASVFFNMKYLNQYRKSLKRIHEVVIGTQADALISFYDFLGGFYNLFYRTRTRFFVVGHQFLTDHPDFPFAEGKSIDKRLFLINNYLNSMGAYKKIALSFRPYQPPRIMKTVVTPPLLREEIFKYETTKEEFLLGYMVNEGYSREIIDWHRGNQQVRIHCFWDKKGEPETKIIHENLIFHQLDAVKFMGLMSRCRGLMTTAGFESICEAMLLGKPVLMVPVSGQYEQACNAIDAVNAWAGIQDDYFNISRFLEFIKEYSDRSAVSEKWFSRSSEIILKELTDF